jgi:hypothetical protein
LGLLPSHSEQLVNSEFIVPLSEELPQPCRKRPGQLILRVWQRLKPQEFGQRRRFLRVASEILQDGGNVFVLG